ncbi:LacI family DNA-binding transcriptional regulator [Reichenbachiella carrageenanivorans]|uniref:LacI family DNA-binding transcriptional regulator n=1 Tax=Reichenbachiella carrageenanivorans TaxID=2979869 RepID=A0ABY6D810_9BACT|nr:LacI family DNA-binding transcriptional regulator [Reichenbachiella carrageenanivorans]UXX81303.1 LacI family DNA-binding transcriptional regulator [Reichenbachiella carrageenanivorans]
MKKERLTTKDIAKLADVSRGTVDRVLHGRGKVSDKAREKVMKVLEEQDYKPNKLAKALQANKITVMAFLIPSPELDEYWQFAQQGLEQAVDAMDLFSIEVASYYFDPKDKEDFINQSQALLDAHPDGVIFAPFFYQESIAFLTQCKEQDIPCVTFNTQLKECAQPFIGQDLFQSGQVAASLIKKSTATKGDILIVHFDESVSNALHMQKKEAGFFDFYSKPENAGYKLTTVNIQKDDASELFSYFDEVFQTQKGIVAVYVTNSKCYKVAQYLANNDIDCLLIGYDLIQENRTYLTKSTIDYLIYQNPKMQVSLAAKNLADHLILNKEMPAITFLPLDIIIKENLDTIK